MSDINWDLAPERTVGIQEDHSKNLYWVRGDGRFWDNGWQPSLHDGWQTIAIRPQPRKTVEDAVEAFPEGFSHTYKEDGRDECDWVAYCIKDTGEGQTKGQYTDIVKKRYNKEYFQLVCPLSEFEACVAAKSEPKWTHTCHGDKCRLLDPDKDCDGCYAIKTEYGAFELEKGCNLKPIKPTITNESMKAVESFAYALMDKEDYNLVLEVKAFREAHDITN